MTRAIWVLRLLLAQFIALAVAFSVMGAFCSCANPWIMRPGQTAAEDIVWRQTYGENNRVPYVTWVRMGLVCARGTGWLSMERCISGWFSAADWSAAVAWPDGVTSIAPTSYAHELLHAHLYATTGDQDDGHTRPEWTTLLLQANAALTKAGL